MKKNYWSDFPAVDAKPKRLPKRLSSRWRFRPSFKTKEERIDWEYRQQQAIKRAKRPRWVRNPPKLSEAGLLRAREIARSLKTTREPLRDVYAAIEGLQSVLDRYVAGLARDLRRRESKKPKKAPRRIRLLPGEGCPRLYTNKSRLPR